MSVVGLEGCGGDGGGVRGEGEGGDAPGGEGCVPEGGGVGLVVGGGEGLRGRDHELRLEAGVIVGDVKVVGVVFDVFYSGVAGHDGDRLMEGPVYRGELVMCGGGRCRSSAPGSEVYEWSRVRAYILAPAKC